MAYDTDHLDEQVVGILKQGGVGLLSTDTIYGLSCLVLDKKAVERVYDLKNRDKNKPLVILLADTGQVVELGMDPEQLEPVKELWPASLTVIVNAENAPKYLHRGIKSLALRVPDNQKLRQLLKETGPLISTSANLEGDEPVKDAKEAKRIFGERLDFYVDKGELAGRASTIAKLEAGTIKIIRQGKYRLPENYNYFVW